jgi:hypothetical protein
MIRPALLSLSLLAMLATACGSSNPTGNATTNGGDDTGTGGDDSSPSTSANPDSGSTTTSSDAGTTSTTTDAGADVDNGMVSSTYPAAHPPFPTLVDPAGNPAMATPKVYLVFFKGYPYETQLTDMAQKIGASSYWSSAVGEYGVGPINYAGMIEVTDTPPTTITNDQVDAYMNKQIAAGTFGTPDVNTIYTIFYPSTTSITQMGPTGMPMSSCTDFGGYHSDTAVTAGGKTTNYAYAVMPTCPTFGDLSGIDAVTGGLSHEWAEAVTDPFPSTNNGNDSSYATVDDDHVAWELLGGAEAGDLCAQRGDAFFKPTGFDYTVQSIWSNAAAKKGIDPCAPKGPAVYFNSVPVAEETVTLNLGSFGGSVTTKGVKIASGASKTIEVDLFSDAATGGPWKVEAIDAIAKFYGGSPTLSFAWDRTSGQNGEKLHLTISVTGKSSFGNAHPFIIVSQLGTNQQLWPALVIE